MPTVNVAALMDGSAVRAIFIGLEDCHAGTLEYARALGIDGEALERSCGDEDDFADELAKAFERPQAIRRAGIGRLAPDITTMLTHPVSSHVLRRMGIDEVDAATLSRWSGECLSIELPGGDCVSYFYDDRHGRGGASVHFGQSMVWEHDWDGTSTIETTARIPDTLMHALEGRLLREVLSHPMLDALDLRIERVGECDQNASTVLHFEAVPMIRLGGG